MTSRPPRPAPDDLLVLHTVRVTGFVDDAVVAQRSGVDQHTVSELLRDHEAVGWVTRHEFVGAGGWTMTERGKSEDARRLTKQLDDTGARDLVARALRVFEPLNARVVRACTDWQLRPEGADRLADNDHADRGWDTRVLDELAAVDVELEPLAGELTSVLPRFGGYHERFTHALTRARAGQVQWVAGVGVASCHAVWMELHEDLLSSLGIARDAEPRRT